MNPRIALFWIALAIPATPTHALYAKPGDKLYAAEESTLIKVEPSYSSATLETLDKGHELTEIHQQGSWTMIATAETIGWVLTAETSPEAIPEPVEPKEPAPAPNEPTDTNTGPVEPPIESKEAFVASLFDNSERPETPEFKKFKAAVWKLHHNFTDSGYVAFTDVQYLGDGIVSIVATDFWLGVDLDLRLGNLQTFYNLWEAADGTGLAIALYIYDQSGRPRMFKNKKSGGVKTY